MAERATKVSRHSNTDAAKVVRTTAISTLENELLRVYNANAPSLSSRGLTLPQHFSAAARTYFEKDLNRALEADGFEELLNRTAGMLVTVPRVDYFDRLIEMVRHDLSGTRDEWDGDNSGADFADFVEGRPRPTHQG